MLLSRRGAVFRAVVAGGYVAWALVCSFALGGGADVLLFFAVWGAVWLAFSLLWERGERTRRSLLRRRGYD